MKIKMLSDDEGYPNGIHLKSFLAGEIYDVPENLARDFIAQGSAELAEQLPAEAEALPAEDVPAEAEVLPAEDVPAEAEVAATVKKSRGKKSKQPES